MLLMKPKTTWLLLQTTALSIALLLGACSQSEKTDETPPAEAQPAAQAQSFEYTPATLAALDSYAADCGGQQIDLAVPVAKIVAAIEDSSFLYATKPLTDCSGIFHRVLRRMKERCPDQAYPPIDTYRDTRDLARWYNEQGKLILVKDALASADLLKPGAVLFFGQRGVTYKNFTVEDLYKRGTGINHMGVVVKVHKDDTGQVASYELFHGHGRPGKTPASTTNYHFRKPTRATYPAFGNGNEQWVAFATLVNPAGELLTSK